MSNQDSNRPVAAEAQSPKTPFQEAFGTEFYLRELNRYAYKHNDVPGFLQSCFTLFSTWFSIKRIICIKIENKAVLKILSSSGFDPEESEFKNNCIRHVPSSLIHALFARMGTGTTSNFFYQNGEGLLFYLNQKAGLSYSSYIPGNTGPFGILSFVSDKNNPLSENDKHFVNIACHIMSLAIYQIDTRILEKETRQEISQAKKEYESVVDGLPQLILLLDEKGSVLRANKALEFWSDQKVYSIKGKSLHEIFCGCKKDRCRIQDFWHNIWVNGAAEKGMQVDTQDLYEDRTIHLQLTRSPDIIPSGEDVVHTTNSILLLRDVSSEKPLASDCKPIGTTDEALEVSVKERSKQLAEINQRLNKSLWQYKQIERATRHSEKELHAISSKLIEVQEQERKRIARELHDGLGQTLTAIKYGLESALLELKNHKDLPGVQTVSDSIPKIRQAIDEVRAISMDLRPSMLDDLGILATLDWFCREFKSVYQKIDTVKRVDIIESDVDINLKLVIYRVVQESMNNAAKYSGANEIRIGLSNVNGYIRLVIQDNGKGFSHNKIEKDSDSGLGLKSMRERVEQSKGMLIVDSGKKGTIVEAIWRTSVRQHMDQSYNATKK